MTERVTRVILGTMGVGGAMNAETSLELMEVFSSYGHTEIDTALMYQGGKTEKVQRGRLFFLST